MICKEQVRINGKLAGTIRYGHHTVGCAVTGQTIFLDGYNGSFCWFNTIEEMVKEVELERSRITCEYQRWARLMVDRDKPFITYV